MPQIPLTIKLFYTGFVGVLVPLYWTTYGPWNFLYFCDVALLVTGLAIWLESPLLISTQALAILVPQTLWLVDLFCRVVGVEMTGVTAYMLDESIPLYLRGLSLFHGWLPFFLLWLVLGLGYDRRALFIQSVAAILILLISYVFAPPPPPPEDQPTRAVNINYVYGITDDEPQSFMAPYLWLLSLTGVNILGFYLPTHFLLRRFVGERDKAASSRSTAKLGSESSRG
jgi:hypothetical protein